MGPFAFKVVKFGEHHAGDLPRALGSQQNAFEGDAREAVKALIVANHFLETDLEKLKAATSMGYARGKALPRDRKDWYDWPS